MQHLCNSCKLTSKNHVLSLLLSEEFASKKRMASAGTKNDKIDKIVHKHHKALAAERKALGKFLHYNGFKKLRRIVQRGGLQKVQKLRTSFNNSFNWLNENEHAT